MNDSPLMTLCVCDIISDRLTHCETLDTEAVSDFDTHTHTLVQAKQ